MGSLYNTPPTFAIYMSNLVLKWIKAEGQIFPALTRAVTRFFLLLWWSSLGGLSKIEELNRAKSALLYSTIDSSEGFYTCPVEKRYRSRINGVFRCSAGESVEEEFVKEADLRGSVFMMIE